MTPAVCDTSHRPDWLALLAQAATIVSSYATAVTLRQLFYETEEHGGAGA